MQHTYIRSRHRALALVLSLVFGGCHGNNSNTTRDAPEARDAPDAPPDGGDRAAERCSADGWCTQPILLFGYNYTAIAGAAAAIYVASDFARFAVKASAAEPWSADLPTGGPSWGAFDAGDDLWWIVGSPARDDCGKGSLRSLRIEEVAEVAGVTGWWSVTGAGRELWLVGCGGEIRHFDGTTWRAEASHTTALLTSVYARTQGDVWAVGLGGTILRDTGAGWTAMPSPTTRDLRSIWAASADRAFAVGAGGTIAAWDGQQWTATTEGTVALWSVSGTGPDDVWAVGDAGTILHFDGTRWSPSASGVTTALHAVLARSATDVVAAGDADTVLRRGPS